MEFQVGKAGTDAKVTPKSHHVVTSPVLLAHKECELCHHRISVKT